MPDLTPNYKVPQPLAAGADPLASIDDTARTLAAYLDGLALTNVGALAAGWGGQIEYQRAGAIVTVHVVVNKANYGAVETITGAGIALPVGCRPPKIQYADGVNPVDGLPRGFQVLTNGQIAAYGYAGATGGIIGSVTYIAVPA